MLPLCTCVQSALQQAQSLSWQIPGTVRLFQVLGSQFQQPVRGIAQPARQHMESEHQQPAVQQPQQQSVLKQQQNTTAVGPNSPPSGAKKTFYKRKLPCPPATEFSSTEGRLLFAEALQQGTMNGFFKLIEQYSTQDEPAFCGLASIAMVLNALSIDPKRPWKGSWRWFHEQLLDCCLPLATVAKEGVVLTQAACLAKCNGANVSLHRYGTFTLSEFRQAVADVCSSGEEHLVVSYSRKAFSQTGDGHFSPVGGYHAGRDLVLILDTARFKYPPHWVPLPMLYEAMSRVDPATEQPRGFLRLSANTRPDSVLFTLDIRSDGSWREAEHFIKVTAPELVQAAAAAGQLATPEAAVSRLVSMAPLPSVQSFIAVRYAAQMCAKDRCVPHTVRQQVLQELRATPLHQVIEPLVQQLRPYLPAVQQQQHQRHYHPCSHHDHRVHSHHTSQPSLEVQPSQQQEVQPEAHPPQPDFLSEKLTMLLLLQEPSAWGAAANWADPQQHKQWQQLLDASAVSIVEGEVQYLRQQLMHIDDVLQERKDGVAIGSAPVCSTCPFQLDCTVKGCIKGELKPLHSAAAAAAAVPKAAAGCSSSSGCGDSSHQQGLAGVQQQPAVAGDGEGCCGGGHAVSGLDQQLSHACCM